MKRMKSRILLGTLSLAVIGVVLAGCPTETKKEKGREPPPLAKIRITGIPFGITNPTDQNSVTPDSAAFVLISLDIKGFTGGGVAILNADTQFPGAGVPKLTIAADVKSSTAESPLFKGDLLEVMQKLSGGSAPSGFQMLPATEQILFSPTNISIGWVTFGDQGKTESEYAAALGNNKRSWLQVSPNKIDDGGVLTLKWADGIGD